MLLFSMTPLVQICMPKYIEKEVGGQKKVVVIGERHFSIYGHIKTRKMFPYNNSYF